MRLLVLRHGRTNLNDKGYFNGQYDEPLNEDGRADARSAREIVEKQKIDLAFCSPLSRTRETAEIVLEGSGVPIEFDPRLMERTMGSLDGRDLGMSGFSPDDLFNYFYDPELPGGFESWPQFFERVHGFISEILQKFGDSDQTILLVTHAGTARAVYYYFHPIPADGNTEEPKMRNCEVAEYAIRVIKDGTYDAQYLGVIKA